MGKTAYMEDHFVHLDVVDNHLQERFAKFQERMRQQRGELGERVTFRGQRGAPCNRV